MKKTASSLVLLLTLILGVFFSAGAADASDADYMKKYTLDDYSAIFKRLGYTSYYDENSTTAPDETVFYYHIMNSTFRNYYDDESGCVIVPYKDFMAATDKAFADYSDMMEYFNERNYWADESKTVLKWYLGGLGGPDAWVALSAYDAGNGVIVAQGVSLDLAYDDSYFVDKRYGYDYITYYYSYTDSSGNVINDSAPAKVCNPLELTLVDTEDGLKISRYQRADYYIYNESLYFGSGADKIKYNSFKVDAPESVVEIISDGSDFSSCFTIFDNNDDYWFTAGEAFNFDINVKKGYTLKSVKYTDNNGTKEIKPFSSGRYSVIPDGNAVLKIEVTCDNHSYGSWKTVKAATCKSEGAKERNCTVCGATEKASVSKLSHNYKTTTTKATLSKNGKQVTKCTACGYTSKTKTIYSVKSVKLSTSTYTYNGKTKSPSVVVKDSKGNTLKKDTDYTVKYASGRKNPGKYTVTVTFKGKYSGTKKLTLTIKPKAPSISSLTSKTKGKAVIKWNNVAGESGYQVYYSTSKNGTYKKVNSYAENKTAGSKTKLKSGKKYYFKVRAYKKTSNGTVYSSWSAIKSIKIK